MTDLYSYLSLVNGSELDTYKTKWRGGGLQGRYRGERETRHHEAILYRGRRSKRGAAEQEVSLLAFEVGGLRITWQPISNYRSFLRGISQMSPCIVRSPSSVSRIHVVNVNIWNTYEKQLSLNFGINSSRYTSISWLKQRFRPIILHFSQSLIFITSLIL